MTKAELRRMYPPKPDGGTAARRVIALWEEQGLPESVFCYVSGSEECSTLPILRFCLKRGIPLAAPLCEGLGAMTARVIPSLSQLRRGRFGILEPPRDAPLMEAPDTVIVPGLAFDREGFRLGRGGGYYDGWLHGKTCRTIGLCRPERLVDRLPRDEWDVPVHMVAAGKGLYGG